MRKLLLVISVLIILSAILFAKPYEQYHAALTENKAEVENVFQGTITENGVGNSYKFLQKNNTEKMLELSAGNNGEISYIKEMIADISATANFKVQFLSTQGKGRLILQGLDENKSVVYSVGWVVTGEMSDSNDQIKWIDSRYSINFKGDWIDTFYNLQVLFDKELGAVNYNKIHYYQLVIECGQGQHALIARDDMFNDHNASLKIEPLSPKVNLVKGQEFYLQANLTNLSKYQINSAAVNLILPEGYGLVLQSPAEIVNQDLQPGETRMLKWQLLANRSNAVNLDKDWAIGFNINGLVSSNKVAVNIIDQKPGKIYYVMTDDLEPADGAGYEFNWGNKNGWLDHEEYYVQLVKKAEKLNYIANQYGAKWTHYTAIPALLAGEWVATKSQHTAWLETMMKIKQSIKQESLQHEYAIHMHSDYDPYLSQNVLSYNAESDGLWANHLNHGWAHLLSSEGTYEERATRVGTLFAYQTYLEEVIGENSSGQSLTARAGSFDFGVGETEEQVSTNAYKKVGFLASSDADGNIEGYTSANYGQEIYFAGNNDINKKTADLKDIGLVEFRLTPQVFLAYDSQDSQTLNNKVEQGLDYFVKNGKVESGVHSIVGFTHAAFVLGSGKWNEVEGGQFQEIEEHLAFLKRNYVAKGLLEFATASQLVEKYIDYYTPELVAIYGKLLQQNFWYDQYEVKLLGQDIPVENSKVKVKYPLRFRQSAYKIEILKNNEVISLHNNLPSADNAVEFIVDDKTAKYSMKIFHNKLIFTLLGKLKMIN